MRRITSLAVSFGLVAALAGAQALPAPPPPPTPRVAPAQPPAPPAPPAALPHLTLELERLGPALRSLDHLQDIDLMAMAFDDTMVDVDAALAGAFDAFDDPQAVAVARGGQVIQAQV